MHKKLQTTKCVKTAAPKNRYVQSASLEKLFLRHLKMTDWNTSGNKNARNEDATRNKKVKTQCAQKTNQTIKMAFQATGGKYCAELVELKLSQTKARR